MLSVDGAIDSKATDVADIVLELLQSTTSERQEGPSIPTLRDLWRKARGTSDGKEARFKQENNQTLLTMALNTDLSKADVTHTGGAIWCLPICTCGSVDDGKSTLIGRLPMKPNSFLTIKSRPYKEIPRPRDPAGESISRF